MSEICLVKNSLFKPFFHFLNYYQKADEKIVGNEIVVTRFFFFLSIHITLI